MPDQTFFKCSKCGSENGFTRLEQSRSIDEASTIIETCRDCKTIKKINSK
jgi:DNA-directed RNA polymerase subunit M/transcription elongation factor TFIIS